MFTPATYRELKNVRVTVKRGVESVDLIIDDWIAGNFSSELSDLSNVAGGLHAAEFANLPDTPEAILRFTREYAPLEWPAAPGDSFQFKIHDFRKAQCKLRQMWKHPDATTGLDIPGAKIRFHAGTITVETPTLKSYLEVDLQMNPPERIRVCKRPGCLHPYFIAEHLRKQFCSSECAAEGQRTVKRDWWQKSGPSWRAKQREQSQKGEFDGAHKKG
jgi:hypothetical protein